MPFTLVAVTQLSLILSTVSLGQSVPDWLCCDTTVTVFGDDKYTVSFKVLMPTDGSEESHIGTLTFSKEKQPIFKDTLEFFMPELLLSDMNNDEIKDVLILNSSSARSVQTFHLYISDSEEQKLIRIGDFEKVYDPWLDTQNNIIVGMARYSCVYYRFYRISENYQLVDLGNDFEDCLMDVDSSKYGIAIDRILKEYGK